MKFLIFPARQLCIMKRLIEVILYFVVLFLVLDVYGILAGIYFLGGASILEILSFTLVFLTLKEMDSKKDSFTKATFKLQKQLTMALCIQVQ